MKFRLCLSLFIAVVVQPLSVRAQGCSCAYPAGGFYTCVSDSGCSGTVQIRTCTNGFPHDSCITCSQGAIELSCCPGNPAYSAYVGGDCFILGAGVQEPAGLSVQAFLQACDGTIVPIVMRLPRPLVDGRRSP
jgi:hypothetical protein